MFGIRTFIVSLLTIGPPLLPAAEPIYFPLQTGSFWVYRAGGVDVRTVEVTGAVQAQGQEYARVRFFGHEVLLRYSPDGTLLEWDPNERREKTWVRFGAAERESFASEMGPCNRAPARIESKSAQYKVPAGEFPDVLEISMQTSCADAGLTRVGFLPYLGIVRAVQTTIAGPMTYDLIYAHVGVTELTAAGNIEFRLTLDALVYTRPELLARLTLKNQSEAPVILNFPSGQTYEFLIKNERGDIIYRWSRGRVFTQAFRMERFTGERNWIVPVQMGASGLQPGKYVAEAYLTTEGARQYAASVAFEYRPAR